MSPEDLLDEVDDRACLRVRFRDGQRARLTPLGHHRRAALCGQLTPRVRAAVLRIYYGQNRAEGGCTIEQRPGAGGDAGLSRSQRGRDVRFAESRDEVAQVWYAVAGQAQLMDDPRVAHLARRVAPGASGAFTVGHDEILGVPV